LSSGQTFHIIGAGFSGLIQAFYLIEAGYSVVVHEREDRVGGLLSSRHQGDFLVESAANAMIANKELERVASRIEVKLEPTKVQAKKRFIYRDGKMRRWPLSLAESLPLMGFVAKSRLLKKKPRFDPGESLKHWAEDHLGAGAAQYIIEPAMQGVFACHSDQLSAGAVFQSLWPSPQRGRLRGSVAPRGGMEEWVSRLRQYVKDKGCRFILSREVTDPMDLENPILAVGLGELKNFANRQKLRGLPDSLAATRLASLTSVSLLFNKSVSHPEGFGCLFPKTEDFYSLGVLFNHNIFPGRASGGHSETWILNDSFRRFSEMSPQALLRYILTDRYQLFGSHEAPDDYFCFPWTQKIPIYDSHLEQFLHDLKQSPPPFLMVGNYLGSLGLSRILFVARQNVELIQEGFYG
jgi:protoporphyrinogen/coproporphyrinogen III oxidase